MDQRNFLINFILAVSIPTIKFRTQYTSYHIKYNIYYKLEDIDASYLANYPKQFII